MKSEKVFHSLINIIYIKYYNINIIQGSDIKRDEFTKYLEKAGVVDNLTEIFINLYEEDDKPKFPTEYIKSNLKSSIASENEAIIQNNKLKEENRKLKQRIIELERGIKRMQKILNEKQQ